MKKYFKFFAVGLFAIIACSEAEKNPIELLNDSIKRAMEINTAVYEMESISICGADTQIVNRTIYIKRNEADTLIGVKVKISDEDSSSLFYDGVSCILIDDYAKKVIIPDTALQSSALIASMLDVQNMIIKRRDGKFVDKNQTLDISFGGQIELDGRLLNIVKFNDTKLNGGGIPTEVEYYFSNDDKFLRKVIMKTKKGELHTTKEIRINELNINAPIADSVFSPAIPKEYIQQFWE